MVVQAGSEFLRNRRGTLEVVAGLIALAFAYWSIWNRLVTFATPGDGFYLKLNETYSGPLLALPVVWLLFHALDEVIAVANND